MREKSVNTMQRNLLLEAYKEEISYWCGIVYGDRNILQRRIEEVEGNPALGEQLSWEVLEHPKSISKLAGKKVLGVKTKARKAAEENCPALREAIDGYVYTLKYIQQNPLPAPQAEHTGDEQPTQSPQRIEFEQERAPLSSQEIAERVRKEPSVLYGQAEIQYWCGIVFGDAHILQYRVEDMQKVPEIGEELAWQVASNPSFFSPFAGKKVLGIKNDARKKAEAGLPSLCSAIEGYAEAVKQARENIVQEHQAQQSRQELSAEPAEQLQKKQTLSKPQKLLEHSTGIPRHEALKTSKQAQHKPPDVRPREVEKPKRMAMTL